MPPIAAAPVITIALGAIGAAAVARWVVREVRRINAELERVREGAAEPARESLQTLRRDPVTGEWRVQ